MFPLFADQNDYRAIVGASNNDDDAQIWWIESWNVDS